MANKELIGRLDQRILICEIKELTDEYNTPIGKKRVIKHRCWAHVTNLHGDEYYAAYGLRLHRELKFTIRFVPDVSESDEILFDGKYYNITFIDNIKYGNRLIEFRAQEMTSTSRYSEPVIDIDKAWSEMKENEKKEGKP